MQRELLLRMLSRKGELIAPGAFLPTAERCGLIADIDRWVIRKAVELAAHSGPFAVNLSATSAGDRDVLDLIEPSARALRASRTSSTCRCAT